MKNITNSFTKIFVVFTNYLQNKFVHKMGVLIFLKLLLFKFPQKSPKTEPWKSISIFSKMVVINIKQRIIIL